MKQIVNANLACLVLGRFCRAEQEEPPGLDSLSSFPTKVEGDNVLVTVPEEIPQQRTLAMAKYRPRVDHRTFVVLGAGLTG